MDPLTQIALLLINTGISVYILLVWLRFLLQLAGADFDNPMSQFVGRATSPVLHPMRRLRYSSKRSRRTAECTR